MVAVQVSNGKMLFANLEQSHTSRSRPSTREQNGFNLTLAQPSAEFYDYCVQPENRVVSKSGRTHIMSDHVTHRPEIDPWGTVIYSCNIFVTGVILFDSKLSTALAANRG